MSTSNQGKGLQGEIERIAIEYQRKGILWLKKIDPPCRIVGKGINRKVIFLENPWLDFQGIWTRHNGRAISLEAKMTDEPKLQFGKGGLTDTQLLSMGTHSAHGAATGVLWMFGGAIRFLAYGTLQAIQRNGARHAKWDQATEIQRGLGFITWDFERILQLFYPRPGDESTEPPHAKVRELEKRLAAAEAANDRLHRGEITDQEAIDAGLLSRPRTAEDLMDRAHKRGDF